MTLGDANTDMLGKKKREKVMLWCQLCRGLCRREGVCPSYPESTTGPQEPLSASRVQWDWKKGNEQGGGQRKWKADLYVLTS